MNIEQAKKQVKYAVISYLSKDEFGDYRIPISRQRPIFLMGPPGIGKTDIMNQIAEEMDIALVSYSMSHHTRQSALGLPFIANKVYDGREYRTTEYTMSEIIASIYDVMESSGKREGILFLDEINCISETLAPSMLQFLQYKVFGRHQVPEGWVIVTAGNPPEYNSSVREFDLATLDRLKRIDVTPDFSVWHRYAQNEEIHTAVLTYLEIKKDDFYSVQTTVDGKEFVTARSWVDLSDMMKLYEQNSLPVNQELIRQYIQDERIARDFVAYYDLFYRYREAYRIDDILCGRVSEKVRLRGRESAFDERITVIRMLMDALHYDFRSVNECGTALNDFLLQVKEHNKEFAMTAPAAAAELTGEVREEIHKKFLKKKKANAVSTKQLHVHQISMELWTDISNQLQSAGIEKSENQSGDDTVSIIRSYIQAKQMHRKEMAKDTGNRLENAFQFIQDVYEENEMLIFVTSLTENQESAAYIASYGSESYYRYNKELLLDQREDELMRRIDGLEEENAHADVAGNIN